MHDNRLALLTLIFNILSGVCSKNMYLCVVSHKAKLIFWEGFGNELSGLTDSQPIIYSEKLLLFMSRLQSPQVCFSLRIIHGFSQWQIVGLQNVFFTIFHPEKLRHSGIWERDNPYNNKYSTALHLICWHSAILCHTEIPIDASDPKKNVVVVFSACLCLYNLVFL